MAFVFRPTYTRIDPRNGKKIRRKKKKWYVRYRDAAGNLKTQVGFTDKEATRQLGAELERRVAREQAGIVGPSENHAGTPLTEHIDDYRRYLLAKGNSKEHVDKTCQRARDVLTNCEFDKPGEITPSPVADCLAALRESGLSPNSSNGYLTAFKGFLNWIVKDGRLPHNPLKHLGKVNTEIGRRHVRRVLSLEDFDRFLGAARNSPRQRYKMAGPDRAMLYLMAACTGFRASELGSLTPESIDLDGDPATVTVKASYSKRRREDVQPLPSHLAGPLKEWLFDKPAGEPLWPGTWAKSKKGSELVRLDLDAAGIVYRDAEGRVYDFHSLRSQFITGLARAGVHPRTAQVLARHSDVNLTMKHYTHLGMADLHAAVENLPGPHHFFAKPTREPERISS
jgi:integrase